MPTGITTGISDLSHPRCGKTPDEEQKPDQAGKHQQHADAAHHGRFTNTQAQPVVAPEVSLDRTPTILGMWMAPPASSTRTAPPPVDLAKGASTSVVEVFGKLARGLGTTFARAFSVPSVACRRPAHSLRQSSARPGSVADKLNVRVLPDGAVNVTSSTMSDMVWR